MHTCIHAHMHSCIYAYMHTCIHAYVYVYIYIFKYINIEPFITVCFLRAFCNLKHLEKTVCQNHDWIYLKRTAGAKKKNNTNTRKDNANLVSCQDRSDLFSDCLGFALKFGSLPEICILGGSICAYHLYSIIFPVSSWVNYRIVDCIKLV